MMKMIFFYFLEPRVPLYISISVRDAKDRKGRQTRADKTRKKKGMIVVKEEKG